MYIYKYEGSRHKEDVGVDTKNEFSLKKCSSLHIAYIYRPTCQIDISPNNKKLDWLVWIDSTKYLDC